MARIPRERSETGIYHVMIRGINKQIIFQDNEDKEKFIFKVKEYEDLGKYIIYSYCLMDNHIHILLKEMEDEISTAIKRISSSYVFWYNNKYDRSGHLFQGRFKSEVVNSTEYLLTVMRYIHKNPVQANIVLNPEDYIWSSYNEYIYEEFNANKNFILNHFSHNKKRALKLFKEYHIDDTKDNCLDIKDKRLLSDTELINIINKLDIDITEIEKLDKVKKYNVLRKLKSIEGTTIRQISRITGVSKSLISSV